MENKYYINKDTLGLYLINDVTKDIYSQETIDTLTEISAQEYQSVLDNYDKMSIGFSKDNEIYFAPNPLPTISVLEDAYAKTVSISLDNFAQKKGYDSIISACSYVYSDVSSFSTEAKVCIDKRDATWGNFYKLFSSYKKSDDVPELVDFLLLLPELVWSDEK